MSQAAADALSLDAPSIGFVPDAVSTAPPGRLSQYRSLLVLRFALVNLIGAGLLFVAWLQGWIDRILAADATHLCALIFAVFAVGLAWAGLKVRTLSRELDALDGNGDGTARVSRHLAAIAARDGHTRAALAGTLRLKLAHRIAPIRHVASTLVLLGLIGTIVGFIIALSGVDPTTVSDTAAIGPMVATLLLGMAMALFKTLVGSVLNIWLMLNYRLLEAGTIHLLTHTIELGERHADA